MERIDEDPVQDPLLAWHRAVKPRTVTRLAWEPPAALKDGRKAPAHAAVTWFSGDSAFVARGTPEPVHGITECVVVGLVTSRISDWKRGWQPSVIGPSTRAAAPLKPAGGVKRYEDASISGAAFAVVPEKQLLAAFFDQTVWYKLDAAAAWLENKSRSRETAQAIDPMSFDSVVDALVATCFDWDPLWWIKQPSNFGGTIF